MRREPLWWAVFFVALEHTGGNVQTSAELAGKHKTTVYRALVSKRYPQFRERFDATVLKIQARQCARVEYRCQAA